MKKIILLIIIICTILISDCFSQWVQQNLGFNGDLNSVYFVNRYTGWVCGVTGPNSTDRIAKTTDGGNTWVRQNASTYYVLNSIQFINNQTGWAAGIHGTIVKTTNGGTNWISLFPTTTWDWNDIQFIDENTGWVAGFNNNVYKTIDGGVSWIPYIYTYSGIRDLSFANSNTGYLIAQSAGGKIGKTTNGGLNWFELPINSQTFTSIYFIDEFTGWTCGTTINFPYEGLILRTTNGGINWSVINIGINLYPRTVFFLNASKGWSSGTNGLILISSNGGINWLQQISGITQELLDIYFIDSLNGWSTGYGGVILHTTNGGEPVGFRKIREIIPNKIKIFQNFPNPFNSMTKIEYEINQKGIYTMTVYDITGKIICNIFELFKLPGKYNIIFNAENLTSGIYFYCLSSENLQLTKKFILLK